jgi:hypothetical protein
MRRLHRLGVLEESKNQLDYVLQLKIEDFMERRLQTIVWRKGTIHSDVYFIYCSFCNLTVVYNCAVSFCYFNRSLSHSQVWPSRLTMPAASSSNDTFGTRLSWN